MATFGLVAFLGAIASVSPLADSGTERGGSALNALSCSVQTVAGGIEVHWSDVPGAEGFTYKIDQFGSASEYGTVTESPAMIAVGGSERVTVGLVPMVDGAPIQARTPCGAALAGEPTISHELRCTLSRDDDGFIAVWNDIDGIVSYGVKLSVGDEENPMYRRTTSTRTRVAAHDGASISVAVAPVFADGTTLPRVECTEASA